jgi:hypothetical protein
LHEKVIDESRWGVTYPSGDCSLSPTRPFTNPALKGTRLLNKWIRRQPLRRRLAMVREALTALALTVLVSGILGVLIYLGADALMEFVFV